MAGSPVRALDSTGYAVFASTETSNPPHNPPPTLVARLGLRVAGVVLPLVGYTKGSGYLIIHHYRRDV